MNLYIVDSVLYEGDSGGPVLNSQNEVVGYIDRGNKMVKDEKEYNAFCPIQAVLEII